MLTLKESLNIDPLLSTRAQTSAGIPVSDAAPIMPVTAPVTGSAAQKQMPASFQIAGPMNEAELTALLMASPIYQKMEQIKQAVAKGAVNAGGHKMVPGLTITGDI